MTILLSDTFENQKLLQVFRSQLLCQSRAVQVFFGHRACCMLLRTRAFMHFQSIFKINELSLTFRQRKNSHRFRNTFTPVIVFLTVYLN